MNSILRNKNSRTGFTLLEVLIAMAILVFIAFGIYQATVETYRLRDTLSAEGDFYSSIRLATAIIQRDIANIYSPILATVQPSPTPSNVPNQPPPPQQNTALNGDLAQTSTFWSPAIDSSGVRPSHFIGTENKLTFISLSHIRIYKDSPESEFSKITYEVKVDEVNKENPGTMVLIKTENSNAFSLSEDPKDPNQHSYKILYGIKKLSYTYYQRDGNTWKKSSSWDSDRTETKNIYPDIIELKIEIVGSKQQYFEGIFKFRPEIPLNGLNPST